MINLDRQQIIPLIEQYHGATREARARWYANRAQLTGITISTVTEVVTLLKQADPSTRLIARTKLTDLVKKISTSVQHEGVLPLIEVFGWSHFSDMNLYDDDAESRTSARSFAISLEHLLEHHPTREEAGLMLIRLYGSEIRHIGPGLTGLLYFLQPRIFPILGQKALRGFKTLFGHTTRAGKEGLKQLAEHLQLIWGLVDQCADVLDDDDMADISGFLYWIATSDNSEQVKTVKEEPSRYRPTPLEDTPLTLSSDRLKSGIDEISIRLAVDPTAVEQAVINLMMGKSLILTGPPGTGKTELARMIPQVFWNIFPMMTTATAEWTAYEVIGGLFPDVIHRDGVGDQLRFVIRPGCVYEAVMSNWEADFHLLPAPQRRRYTGPDGNHEYDGVWLVIDEFNRADIDRAFGDLFTSLESGQLRVPSVSQTGEMSTTRLIPIPVHFRIIGTLNTFDKHHLFEMSDALKRRFAFVEIRPHPDISVELHVVLDRAAAAIRQHEVSLEHAMLQEMTTHLFEWIRFVRVFRTIGTAQLISALTYAGLRAGFNRAPMVALAEGVISHILPQLEGLTRDQLDAIVFFTRGDYDTLFTVFERRVLGQRPSRHDLRDLQRFAAYLAQNSDGAQQELLEQIVHTAVERSDESYDRLEILIEGGEAQTGWRDAFSMMAPEPTLPTVADALQELADEGS